jgi:hypothetical protein
MAIDYNKVSLFSVEGTRFRRLNWDGTQPKLTRTVGGPGTYDLSFLSGTTGDLTIKLDDGAEDTQTVDFLPVVDQEAVTVAELVTAIGLAGFTDVTFSAEAITGYIMAAYSGAGSPVEIQIYGEIAGALGFGMSNGQYNKDFQLGTAWIKNFESTVSVAETKNLKDGEEVETEDGTGVNRSVIIDPIIKGENPVVTLNDNNYELKAVIQGGKYDATTRTYTPPGTDDVNAPRFRAESYTPEYQKGSNKRADKVDIERKIYYSATGIEGDVSKETKAFGNIVFNVTSTEWTDENGDRQNAFDSTKMTLIEFDASLAKTA